MFRQAIEALAKQAQKSADDVDQVIELLNQHWIVDFSDWQALSDDQKKDVGLPVWLRTKLDLLAASPDDLSSFLSSSTACSSSPSSSTNEERGGNKTARLPDGSTVFMLRWKQHGLSLSFGERLFELSGLEPVSALLARIAARHAGHRFRLLESGTTCPVADEALIGETVLPGAVLCVTRTTDETTADESEERRYRIVRAQQPSTVEAWLASFGMDRHYGKFLEDHFLDFWALIFLERASLEHLGIESAADQDAILAAVQQLVNSSRTEINKQWLCLLGCHDLVTRLVSKNSNAEDFSQEIETSTNPAHHRLLREISVMRSSEAIVQSFLWMKERGFDESAFVSVRSNLPFYLIPAMTTSVHSLELILPEDRAVYEALHRLKESPTFQARALCLWLRDLGLDRHRHLIAKLRYNSIERLQNLAPQDRRFFGDWEVERLRVSIDNLSSDHDAVIERMLSSTAYGDACKRHLISIEMLPKLNAARLQKMGVDSPVDRALLLELCSKYRAEIPSRPYKAGRNGSILSGRSSSLSSSSSSSSLHPCVAVRLLGAHRRSGADMSPPLGINDKYSYDDDDVVGIDYFDNSAVTERARAARSGARGGKQQKQKQKQKQQQYQYQSIDELVSFIEHNSGTSKSHRGGKNAPRQNARQAAKAKSPAKPPPTKAAPVVASKSSPTLGSQQQTNKKPPVAASAPTHTDSVAVAPAAAPSEEAAVAPSAKPRIDLPPLPDRNRSFAVEALLALQKVLAPAEFQHLISESPETPANGEDAMFWMD